MAGSVFRRVCAGFRAAALAAMTMSVAACGGGGDSGGGAGISAPPAVGTVTVSVPGTPLQVGAQQTATVELRSASGVVLTGRPVTWTSSNSAVATVTDGVITGIAPGSVSITASSEGKVGTAAVTVVPVPVASVNLLLRQNTLLPGGTTQAIAETRDAAGRPLTGRVVTYVSSNPAVATVNGSGVVTALAAGSAIVSATSEGQTGQATLQVLVPVSSVVISGSTRVKVGDNYTYTATARAADGSTIERPVTWRVRETARAQMTPAGELVPLQSGAFTIVAQIDGVDWDASYTAYDWDSFTSGGDGFLSIESDARVANRFGTLQYTQLVMSCGPTSRFFLWVRVPHMVTSNGLVTYGIDNGPLVSQFWEELSPSFNTLWTPGSSSTVRSFAQTLSAGRRFVFAFTEFNSSARAMTFRVTGLSSQLPALLARCPSAIMRPGQAVAVTEPSDARATLEKFATRTATGDDVRVRNDAMIRATNGPTAGSSPLLMQWPTWQVPEVQSARRVTR